MTPTHPRYARIHVSPSPGTEEWPVVERVAGGWQSGGHHYPDSTVIDYEPLHLHPDPLATIRDGLPTVDEIRTALQVLQIPVDEQGMGLAAMAPDRQRTCLLGVLFAWIVCYQCVNEFDTDPLDAQEMAMLVSSSVAETSDGNAVAEMNSALWNIQWAAFSNREMGRGTFDNPNSPASAIDHLLRAAGLVLTAWREIHGGEGGLTLNGENYHLGNGTLVLHGRDETAAALKAVEQLLPPEYRG